MPLWLVAIALVAVYYHGRQSALNDVSAARASSYELAHPPDAALPPGTATGLNFGTVGEPLIAPGKFIKPRCKPGVFC